MYRASTARSAEAAAIQGTGAVEWDTQDLRNLQEQILSSSPAPPPEKVASRNESHEHTAPPSIPRRGESDYPLPPDLTEDEAVGFRPRISTTLLDLPAKNAPRPQVKLQRESRGRIRPFVGEAQVQLKPGTPLAALMEDLTQKSSLSLTQENPESVYEQFNLQRQLAAQYRSTATPDEEEQGGDEDEDEAGAVAHDLPPAHESANSKHHTESTGITYHEDDTGHIKLDFGATPDDLEDDAESQDASPAAPEIELFRAIPSYEPETPAPQLNPFANKGTVMKDHELFGATQPTPFRPQFSSPATRPSPDVYKDFTSPLKRQTTVISPLTDARTDIETSPLQHSVKRLLSRATSELPAPNSTPVPRTSRLQSFDDTSQQQSPVEPRPYVSMKESQERRRGTTSIPDDSDTDDSDSGLIKGRRMREIDKSIQRELSKVVKRDSSRPVSSNSPVAATEVEVPSTSRRRSQQEDYIAQCEGTDARDTPSQSPTHGLRNTQHTQHDDVIADSQGVTNRPSELQQNSTVPDSPVPQAEIEGFHESSQKNASLREQSRNSHKTLENDHRENEPEIASEPNLPLQEVSPNSKTPVRSSQIPVTVPETSPNIQQYRSMAEIANISFSNHEDLIDIPAFTQDIEYENAMGIQSSPPRKFPAAPTFNTERTKESMFQKTDVVLDDPDDTHATSQPEDERNINERPEQANDKSHQPPQLLERANSPPTNQPHNHVAEAISSHLDHNQTLVNVDGTASLDDGQGEAQDLDDLPAKASMVDSSNPSPKKGASRIKKYGRARTMIVEDNTEASNAQNPTYKRFSARLSSSTSTPRATPQRRGAQPSSRKSSKVAEKETAAESIPQKRTLKRKSAELSVLAADPEIETPPTRSSKRQSKTFVSKAASEDPSALAAPAHVHTKDAHPLFESMAFAVSYGKNEKEKDNVVNLISTNGGLLLQDGFDTLFEFGDATHHEAKLELSAKASSLKFAAVIADEHSRKPKYMQALALGLPGISGRWIQDCISRQTVIDWSPYLLCAGQSSFLGNAYRSRTLQSYSATDAILQNTIESRDKLLEGQSILIITGRGKNQDKRQTFLFLARALGPIRLGQAVDYIEARKKLLDGENQGQEWDLLHVDTNDKAAADAVFGSPSGTTLKKRKRGPTAAEDEQPPKKIRIINDETMIQSLIFGKLLEE